MLHLMESVQMKYTRLLYIQFIQSTVSLLMNYLKKQSSNKFASSAFT